MAERKELVKWYFKDTVKKVVEGSAFLIQGLILGGLVGYLFNPQSILEGIAPGAIAFFVFAQSWRENYCFITKDLYGDLWRRESEETTLADFEEEN